MNVLFYAILFLIGSGVGSFWAVKAKEIPKSLDMIKTHYSTNCKPEYIYSNWRNFSCNIGKYNKFAFKSI